MTQPLAEEPRGSWPATTIERLPAPFAKFLLKRRLARGGMAEVFLAGLSGAEGFEKELVVKLIRPDLSADEAFVRRFVEEAKTCVRLAHPNIVSIFELGVEQGVLYMVMELVRGATLAEILAAGPLEPEEGVYVALEVARALDHAHRRGVIHRDVTPGNVMVDDEGAVKLLDFGIAAPAHSGSSHEVFGTPGHMPPEQMDGARLSPASDLFALGTVVVEAWTGRAPFRRADARGARTAMAEGLPRLPSAEHPELAPLDDLVRALLALAPERRPQHAEDVARRLRGYLRERELDLDEIARGLRARVAAAVAVREARAQGRSVPSPPMPRTIRPTPLAEGTKTFASRGDVDAWQATRPLPVEETGTRKLVEPPQAPPSSSPTPVAIDEGARRRSVAPYVIAAVVLAVFATIALSRRSEPRATSPAPTAIVPSSTLATAASAATAASTTVPTVSAAPAASQSTASSSSPSVASSAMARLVVVSSPPANVELDGRPVGRTTLTLTVPVGEHRVVLRPQGLGESFERRVTLSSTSGAEIRGDFNDEPSIVVRKIPSR